MPGPATFREGRSVVRDTCIFRPGGLTFDPQPRHIYKDVSIFHLTASQASAPESASLRALACPITSESIAAYGLQGGVVRVSIVWRWLW